MLSVAKVKQSDVERFLMSMGASRQAARRAQFSEEAMHRMVKESKHVVRRHNPVVQGVLETIDQPIYDSFSIAANTAFPKTVLFQNQIGSGGKTLAQTNMVQSGQLPNPQKLELHTIGVWIANNTTLTDLINILTNVSFTLTVNTKPYLQVPPLFLPAGCGAVLNAIAGIGSSLPATSAVGFSTGNGITDMRAVFSLSCPFMIETGESFNVTLNPETPFNTQANSTNPPGVGTTIYVKLDGILYRAVS